MTLYFKSVLRQKKKISSAALEFVTALGSSTAPTLRSLTEANSWKHESEATVSQSFETKKKWPFRITVWCDLIAIAPLPRTGRLNECSSSMKLGLSEQVAVIVVRGQRQWVSEWVSEWGREASHCIIQRGCKIMHHLCPFPSGPVTIDPHPSTFSDTPFLLSSFYLFFLSLRPLPSAGASACQRATQGIAWVFAFLRACPTPPLADLSTGLCTAGPTRRAAPIFSMSLFLLSLKIPKKVKPFQRNVRCNWPQRAQPNTVG